MEWEDNSGIKIETKVILARENTYAVWNNRYDKKYWIDPIIAFKAEIFKGTEMEETSIQLIPICSNWEGSYLEEGNDQIKYIGTFEKCSEYIKNEKETKTKKD